MRTKKITLLLAVWLAMAKPALAIVYPQVALGGGYQTILIVNNMSNEALQEVRLYLYQGALQPWIGSWSINGTSPRMVTGDFHTGFLVLFGSTSQRYECDFSGVNVAVGISGPQAVDKLAFQNPCRLVR